MTDSTPKLPKGVEVRGSTVRISFTLDGVRFREPYAKLKVTENTIKWAGQEVDRIRNAIKLGTFNYVKEFPDSPRALKVLSGHDIDIKRTVGDAVTSYLDVYKLTKQKSGLKAVMSKSNHIRTYFTDMRQLRNIKKIEIEKFKVALISPNGKYRLSPKTANLVLGILDKLFDEAVDDLVIDINISRRVKKYKIKKNKGQNAFPLTRQDISTIENLDYPRVQDKNMFLFNMWTGMSVSELRALAWEDIDLENNLIHIKRAEVEGEIKCPKEIIRERTIEILEPALYWLMKQREHTSQNAPALVKVIQDDSISIKDESITFVFLNEQTNQNNKLPIPFTQKPMERCFDKMLKSANIETRGPNQCRHTFASQAVSNYVPLEWVARQLGHCDTTMVKQHYGQWIPQDIKPMSKLVGEMMSVDGRYLIDEIKS